MAAHGCRLSVVVVVVCLCLCITTEVESVAQARQADPVSFLETTMTRLEGSFSKRRVVDSYCDNRNADFIQILEDQLPSNCTFESAANFSMVKRVGMWWVENKRPEDGYWNTTNCKRMREQPAFAGLSHKDQRCVCWATKALEFAEFIHREVSDRGRTEDHLGIFRMGLFSPELTSGSAISRLGVQATLAVKILCMTPLMVIVGALVSTSWMGSNVRSMGTKERFPDDHGFVNVPFMILAGVGMFLVAICFLLRYLSQNIAAVSVILDQSATEHRGWYRGDLLLVVFLGLLGAYNFFYMVFFFVYASGAATVRMRALSEGMTKAILAVTIVRGMSQLGTDLVYRQYTAWVFRFFFFLHKASMVSIDEVKGKLGIYGQQSLPDISEDDEPEIEIMDELNAAEVKKNSLLRRSLGFGKSSKLELDGGASMLYNGLTKLGEATGPGKARQTQSEWVDTLGLSDEMLLRTPSDLNMGRSDQYNKKPKRGHGLIQMAAKKANIGIADDHLWLMRPMAILGISSYFCEGIYMSKRMEEINGDLSTALLLMSGIQVTILQLIQGNDNGGCLPPLLDPTQYDLRECQNIKFDETCIVKCNSPQAASISTPFDNATQWEQVEKHRLGDSNASQNGSIVANSTDLSSSSNMVRNENRPKGFLACNPMGQLVGQLPICSCPYQPEIDLRKYDPSQCVMGAPVGSICWVHCRAPYTGTGSFFNCSDVDGRYTGELPSCVLP